MSDIEVPPPQGVPLISGTPEEAEFSIKREPIEIEDTEGFPEPEDKHNASFGATLNSRPLSSKRQSVKVDDSFSVPKKRGRPRKKSTESNTKISNCTEKRQTVKVEDSFSAPKKRGRPRIISTEPNTKNSFNCPEIGCEYSCASDKTLSLHIARKHSVKSRKPAKHAQKMMKEAVDISGVEIRIELTARASGRSLYKCSRCKMVFLKRSAAEAHISNVHLDVKRYTCSVCGWGFQRSRDLDEHARVHTGERPFVCPVDGCGYASSWCTTVYRHVRRHHKDYQGELTPKTVSRVRSEPVEQLTNDEAKADGLVEPVELSDGGRDEPSTNGITIELNPQLIGMESIISMEEEELSEKMSLFEEVNIKDGTGSQYTCNICTKDFEQLSNIRRHLNREHLDVKKRTCNVCGMAVSNVSNLPAHVRSHTGERPFKCGSCKMDFVTVSDLRRHAKRFNHTHDYSTSKVFNCVICEVAFRSFRDLEKHVWIHTVDSDPLAVTTEKVKLTPYESAKIKIFKEPNVIRQTYTCALCNKKLKTLKLARNHVVKEHRVEKSLSCIYCGFTKKSRSALKKHVNDHANSKLFKCSNTLCKYASKLFTELQEHIIDCTKQHAEFGLNTETSLTRFEQSNIAISGKRTLKCVICSSAFNQLPMVREHLKTEHPKPERYGCPRCDATFPDANSLAQHLAGHEGVEPLRCPVEGCQFTMVTEEDQEKHRRWHEKRINPPPKAFACRSCGKQFEIRTSLARHMKKQHGKADGKC
ncbi:zinc finger protein 135 [Aedes albopictus]|uniref:C2H2-type domain-containing protein n=1 Tax=Aedes albopictus TaxID=7160 RepID=A0ABM2A3X2_AEDAL|nr:zinc finger protein 135-like [Aedes albopictus]XP_019532050.2 zinc finger protein 135-like [Aedes albopictus]